MRVTNDVIFGKDVRIFHPNLINLYDCMIGEGTTIGPFIEVQRSHLRFR